jgi:hypothetical protein
MGRLEAVLLFEYARDWYTHGKSRLAQSRPPPSWGAAIRPDPRLMSLPLGYHSQEELPQLPMAQRRLDVFFAGQVKHEIPRNDYRHWVSTSKFIAREQLWKELGRLNERHKWNLDLGKVAASEKLAQAPAFESYSEKMMNTRICVAPRGSVAETYRASEGLRAGCLVVANRLPPAHPFANSPILQIDHWRQLEGILDEYARNINLLEEARTASLEWWDSYLAVKIQAGRVARELNEAAQTMFTNDCSVSAAP